MTDFSHIPARHAAINQRLEDWAKWVRVKPQAWLTQPMFRQYQSKSRQWETPEPKIELNTAECFEVERAVAALTSKHRTAIRWAYAFSWVPLGLVRRELGLTNDALGQLIEDARDMVKKSLTRHANAA